MGEKKPRTLKIYYIDPTTKRVAMESKIKTKPLTVSEFKIVVNREVAEAEKSGDIIAWDFKGSLKV